MNRFRMAVIGLGLCIMGALVGCDRVPYDAPEYQDIAPNETAFLIKLDGENNGDKGQAQFQSESFLAQNRVATKRVQITHKWIQTGRWASEGHYVPEVTLIKIDRSAVTRQWTKDEKTGTSAQNQAVSLESKDSINFSIGWVCTAYIDEKDGAKFLYRNPSGSLAKVMDTEVLGRVQKVSQLASNSYMLSEVPAHKAEIQKSVEADIVPYFAERGITIVNLGMYGGLSYENPKIQAAIDEAAAASNLQVVEQAKLEAQSKTNQRLTLAAEGEAEAARRKAQGEADAKLLTAEAEAKGIKAVNDAISQSGNLQGVIALRQLEIANTQASKWNGQTPVWYMGGGNSGGMMPNLLMNVPSSALPTTQPSK